MISCKYFFDTLKLNGTNFYTGVPDSLLKCFCSYLQDNFQKSNNIIAANEGNAVALATGHYLSTSKIPLVYMQNSGLGNAVNPLTSLVDPDVYSIPILLLIGWRGQPGFKDEPQHLKQGKITLELLDVLEIPYNILTKDTNSIEFETIIKKAYTYMQSNNAPYALVICNNTFEEYISCSNISINDNYPLTREEVLNIIVDELSENDIVVSTTGKTSRELFEIRQNRNQSHHNDFLTVGSMGHSSSIALGIALKKEKNNVYCIDGDGSVIMHMGALAIIGNCKPKNYKHIILNNGSHDSVGGQPTVGFDIDICSIAKSVGYNIAFSAFDKPSIIKSLKEMKKLDGPALLEVKIKRGSRKDLGRPSKSPIENKKLFMEFLSSL